MRSNEFRARARAAGLAPIVSHASYLINLASANPTLHAQSMEAMGDELDRAEALDLMGVVLHPGCIGPTDLHDDRASTSAAR